MHIVNHWPGRLAGLSCIAAVLVLMLVLGSASAAESIDNAEALEAAATSDSAGPADAVETEPANQGIRIFIDSVPLELETAPIIENDRVLVPVKGVFEAMGARVIWQANTQGIVVQKDDATIIMHLYHPLAYINQEPTVMDVPPVAREERTFVPLRFVSQAMSYDVQWNPASQTVSLNRVTEAVEAAHFLQ